MMQEVSDNLRNIFKRFSTVHLERRNIMRKGNNAEGVKAPFFKYFNVKKFQLALKFQHKKFHITITIFRHTDKQRNRETDR